MTILIADDDRVRIQLVTAHLKKTGFIVSAAFDAIQAFTTAIRILPSVILLDVNMPGGTGIEVLRRLKNFSKTNRIPVIVVSGSVDTNTADLVKAMGADDYLRKPVDVDELSRAIHRVTGTAIDVAVGAHKKAAPDGRSKVIQDSLHERSPTCR